MMTRPHAFVAMPFGVKPGPDNQPIDFNRVYGECIAPALDAAGLQVFPPTRRYVLAISAPMRTIQQAFNIMCQLELSFRSQVDAMAARTELAMPSPNGRVPGWYRCAGWFEYRPYGVFEWPTLLRLLAAQQQGSAYPPYWS